MGGWQVGSICFTPSSTLPSYFHTCGMWFTASTIIQFREASYCADTPSSTLFAYFKNQRHVVTTSPYLWHVVLHRLHHHSVLESGVRHLHPPGAPDSGVRHVTIATDLIACVHNHLR